MNPTAPANKPIFETPLRVPKNTLSGTSLNKDPPPSTIQYQQSCSPFAQNLESPHVQPYSSVSNQIRIKISERARSFNNDNQYSYSSSEYKKKYQNQNEKIYENANPEQLFNVIYKYEDQIKMLKEYITRADLLDRSTIVDIFGFQMKNFGVATIGESKIVLKELKFKINKLIEENTKLKKQLSQPKLPENYSEYHLLIRQNQKLRAIIDQQKNSEDKQMQKLQNQVYTSRRDNENLNLIIKNLRNRIETMQEVDSRKSLKQSQNKQSRPEQIQRKQIIPQIKPIKQTYNNTALSHEDVEFARKQLTKQMFGFEQDMQQINKNNKNLIDTLNKKVQVLQMRIKEYERQRRMKIEQTIRKSFLLTENLTKPQGDQDLHGQSEAEEDLPQNRQEGRIKRTNIFGSKKQQIVIQEQKQESSTFKQVEMGRNAVGKWNNKSNDNNSQRHSTRNNELKLLQDSFAMEQMKNKNITEQNNVLKKKMAQLQNRVQQKIQRNIQLESVLSHLEQKKKDREEIKLVENQIKIIREALQECNIDNFQLFFQEFNQILQQKRILSEIVSEYQSVNSNFQKQKNKQLAFESKIEELIQQNKRLIKLISSLQTEVDRYHHQIITNQIQKLNSINLNQMCYPSGQNAIEWQKQVKNSIEVSLKRLQNLEHKARESKLQRKPVQKTIEKETHVIERKKLIQVSQARSAGSR